MRLQKNRTKYDLCKFCSANRIVNIWNSLPSYVVSAETVNCFKTRLNRFWLNQDIIYNFRSEIHGTGSRSEITVKIFIRVGIVVCSGKEAIACACFLSTSTSRLMQKIVMQQEERVLRNVACARRLQDYEGEYYFASESWAHPVPHGPISHDWYMTSTTNGSSKSDLSASPALSTPGRPSMV